MMERGILQRRRGRRLVIALAAAAVALTASAGSALAKPQLTPGAVFTETNTAPNYVLAFNRSEDGTLTPAGQFATKGDGRQGNPPSGFPTLDAAGPVELSADGQNKACLFVVNAGSNTVSSFRVRPDGLEWADQESSGGSRPISVTSTTRGPDKQVLYVLNSDVESASIQGYYVSGSCGLTPIPGSSQSTSSPDSIPAQIRFDRTGRFLAVSERFAPVPPAGNGDIDIFPVDKAGVAGAPVVNPSAGRTPYGLDWNNHDILSVSNENVPDFAGSTVTNYALSDDGKLTPLATAPSPGAACWNVFTNNGKFEYVTKPLGQAGFGTGTNVDAFRVDHDGTLTLVNSQPTNHNAIDDALSHDSRFLYVLSVGLLPPAAASAINEYSIDPATGAITPIGALELPGSNSTAGLAAW
jgi:6-phosphogluconolactonase